MPTINFRMTEEQHAELKAAAKAAGRSLQRELEWRAFRGVDAPHLPVGARMPTPEAMDAISASIHVIPEWTPAAEGTFRPEDGLTEEDVTEIVGLLETPAAPSVPPVPARRGRDEQRGRAAARPAKGPCPHRVPEGQFCKRCGA